MGKTPTFHFPGSRASSPTYTKMAPSERNDSVSKALMVPARCCLEMLCSA